MSRSGDMQNKLTAETRSRGEDQKPTTEARRHGERSGDLVIARDRVIGVAVCSDQDVTVKHTIDLCHPERVGAHATASRRTPTTPALKYAASGSSYETTNLTAETRSRGEITRSTSAPALITKIMRILLATLREIFDESAYDRFLHRTKVPRSVTSYRDFMQEREAGMTRRPKCC